MGNNRTLFGFFIEVAFIGLGIYIIILNLNAFATYLTFHQNTQLETDFTTFYGWHNHDLPKGVEFKGFQWFWDEIGKFPGLDHTIKALKEIFEFSLTEGEPPSDIIGWLQFIGNCIIMPVKIFVTVFVDSVENIKWFINMIW